MIRSVLFDVDGTLVDSNDLHAAAWQEAFRHFGVDLPLADVRVQIGKGGDNLIPSLLPPDLVERRQAEIEEFRSDLFRRDYLPKVRPFPGIRPLFERLKADGVRIVLATSARQEELDHHVELMGIRDLIDAATSKDDVDHSKPCPDLFEAAFAKAEVPDAEMVRVVGDTVWDMEAAARAGIPAVAVLCGGFARADLAEAGAIHIFEGPGDLLDRYDRWTEA